MSSVCINACIDQDHDPRPLAITAGFWLGPNGDNGYRILADF